MKKYTLLTLLTVIIIASCGKKETETFIEKFNVIETITLKEAMPELKNVMQEPNCFYFLNHYILVSEPKLDSILLIFDTQTKEYKHTISKGQGTNEALKISNISMGNKPNSCSLFDNLSQLIYIANIDSLSSISIKKDTLLHAGNTKNSVAYDDTLAFYENVNEHKRFTLASPSRTIHFGNEIQINNLSPIMLTKVLQGPCSLSSSKKRFFWFSSYGDVFEIYDYSNIENITTICSLALNLPNANMNGALGLEDKLGAISVTSDNNYIYALYSGKTLEQCLKDRSKALYSDKILIFDWDGNPCKVLNLDREVFSIAYSEMYDKLYCLGLDDDLNYTIYAVDNI